MNAVHLLAAASALAIAAVPALADQSGAPPPPPAAQDATGNLVSSAADTIVVTGSRIRRQEFGSLEPTVVIGNEYLVTRGLTNIGEALNEIPGFGIGVTPEGGQSSFGVGQSFVNLFGLGTARTLTVVNGRRFVSSNAATIFGPAAPGLQVDLNVIPAIMVERTDVIYIGGAPAYGSDAIAGTVNIITRRSFEGFEVRGTTGITAQGDNHRYNVSGLGGVNFGPDDRGNVMAALSYDFSGGVLAIDRRRFRESLTATAVNPLLGSAAANAPPGRRPDNDGRVDPSIPFNTGNADGIPNNVFIRNARLFRLTPGGVLSPRTGATLLPNGLPAGFGPGQATLIQFNPQGNLVPFNPGVPFGIQNASGGDGFFLAETLPLLNDLDRFTANVQATYRLADSARLFFEGTYYRASSTELIDQPIFNNVLFGGLSAPLNFQSNDPRLTPQASAELQRLGVTAFRLNRGSRDIVTNNAQGVQELYRLVGGVTGDFKLFGRDWTYEASANYGWSQGTYEQTVLNQQNFVNAVNVTRNDAGQIVCNIAGVTAANNVAPNTTLPIADPACVPLDLFGEGRASPQALAYVTARTRATATLEQEVYNANVTGELFNVWGGAIGAVAGYEHRVERADFSPDAFQRAGRGRAVAIGPNSGGFNTHEVFGEVLVPLIGPENDIPLVRMLTLQGKVRHVENSVNGGFTTYTAGGRYAPLRDVEFRGNFTRSLRAPAVTELFTPPGNIFTTVPDPCDSRNVGAGARPATRARNCAAFYAFYGLDPRTFNSVAVGATVPGTSGGDPNLRNETADAYTFGAIFRPRFIPRLSVAVDWNKIYITGNIANLNATAIATGCFDNENFNTADIPNANQFCSRLQRDPNGQIRSDPRNPGVITGFVNGAFIDFQGLQAQANYNFPLGDVQVVANGSLFYLDRLVFNDNGIVPNPNQGEVGNSQIEAQLNVGFIYNLFRLDLQTRFADKAKFDNLNTVETQDILSVGSYWIFNLAASVNIDKKHLVRLTVSNLTDAEPPFPAGALGFGGVYDTLGRRFALSFVTSF